MLFLHQHIDDQNLENILTGTITSFKDIKIEDIKDTDYLLIDLDGTIIDCFDIYRDSQTYYNLFEFDIDNDYSIVENFFMYLLLHEKNCGLRRNIDMKLNAKYLQFFYITEHDINETISKFKQSISNLKIHALSRSWPGRLFNNIYSREAQLAKLGINVIEKYIWTKHIDKGVFLCGWNGSLQEYCECCYDFSNIEIKNQPGYFDLHPEMIGKNIVIIDNDIDQLNYIYNAYKQKYPEHISKLKLYLYKNRFVLQIESGNSESTITEIQQEYCDCKQNNQSESYNKCESEGDKTNVK